jgi:CBS domain-containing protein
MKVGDVMRHPVASLRADDNLDLAEALMLIGRIRHLPIVDGSDRLLGLVTHRDVLEASMSSVLGVDRAEHVARLRSVLATEVMVKDVVTASAQDDAVEALDLMIARKIGCLPVVENERVVGLITETDWLLHLRRLLVRSQAFPAPA